MNGKIFLFLTIFDYVLQNQIDNGIKTRQENLSDFPAAIFIFDQLLHRYKRELRNENQCDNGCNNILLGIFTGKERDQHISDTADTDTVGNGISKGHHDQRQERRNRASDVKHINV